jgi:uncharacterized protein YdaT
MSDWSDGPNVTAETRDAVEWGKKVERERIVALLESNFVCANHECESKTSVNMTSLIALIKGENE